MPSLWCAVRIANIGKTTMAVILTMIADGAKTKLRMRMISAPTENGRRGEWNVACIVYLRYYWVDLRCNSRGCVPYYCRWRYGFAYRFCADQKMNEYVFLKDGDSNG